MHIAVVGGGVIGLATARALLQEGHEVLLLDRADGPGAGASAQNGAQLSYGYVAPLASPAIPLQIPRLLLARHSPLRLRPGLAPAAWLWCLQFLAACNQAQSDRATRALLAVAMESQWQFDRWRANVPDASIAHQRQGKLVLYRSQAGLAGARRQVALQAGFGPAQELLDARQCLALEPALDGTMPLAGGVWTPSEAVADCAKVCTVLAAQLASEPRYRALWAHRFVRWEMRGGKVTGLQAEHAGALHTLRFDACVIAAGAQSASLVRPLGVRLPIQPLKGYSIDVPAAHVARMPVTSLTDTSLKTVFAPLDTGAARRLRVAGFAELVGQDTSIDPHRIARLLDTVRMLFGLRGTPSDLRPWAGLRPATPTGLPTIGRARGHGNVFVNAGQGALGFTLAFGSAELLCAVLAGRRGDPAAEGLCHAGLAGAAD